jgi:hypothetical protein
MSEANFDQQWDEAINRIRFVAGTRACTDIARGSVQIRILPALKNSPIDEWTISRHEKGSEDGVRTYSVSEIPGELHAYTFFPTLKPMDLLKGQAHIDAMYSQDVYEQEQLGLATPTEEDYQRFFRLTEEIIELSI